MTSKDDVREFLVSRRANVTPAQAGIRDFGGERRVPGLWREELAQLTEVSLDYYTRLERGNIRGASESNPLSPLACVVLRGFSVVASGWRFCG